MTISDNINLAESIKKKLDEGLPRRLGVNKRNELERLVYEICLSSNRSPKEVLSEAGLYDSGKEDHGGFFHKMKKELLSARYPSLEKNSKVRIMPLKFRKQRNECAIWNGKLEPHRIFVEKEVRGLDWTKDLINMLSGAQVIEIDSVGEVRESAGSQDTVSEYNQRRDNLIVTSNKASFIKICPCTKGAARCGYWILNLGFGCPFDCSYCYLQTYSNIPGIVLTANIEDYYDPIMEFDASVAEGRVRIGTGEFTDSLALDRYTGYAGKLIDFFRDTKNLILELKTKTSDIENVLSETPHENVVISWSINTPRIAGKYEKGASPVDERIGSALLAARKGYKVSFHFDPLMWYPGWEKEYEDTVNSLFSYPEIRENTQWISLGTLRYTPGLKQAAEQRFEDNMVFYEGDFFLDYDGKFRYPEKFRREMYLKMESFIRKTGVSCWIYLCMEPPELTAGK